MFPHTVLNSVLIESSYTAIFRGTRMFPVTQWSSTWATSSPRARFYALWGRFLWFTRFGGDFCTFKHTRFLNWLKKTIFITLESKQAMQFRLHGS